MRIPTIGAALAMIVLLASPASAYVLRSDIDDGVASAAAAELDAVTPTSAQVRARGRAVRVDRSVNVNRRVVRNRNVNVNVNRPVVRRPVVAVRPWRPRPHYGTFIAGVALGTIVTAAVIGAAPAAPAPNVCWYWADPSMSQGYWDYCR
jgi:hypothetical protein